METVLFISLMILTFCLLERHSPLYSMPLAASILTRAEGWFLFFAILTYLIFRWFFKRKVNLIKELLFLVILTTLIISPYLWSNLRNTSNLLPNTALAKTLFFGEIGLPFKTKLEFFSNGLKLFMLTWFTPFSLLFLFFCLLSVKFFIIFIS